MNNSFKCIRLAFITTIAIILSNSIAALPNTSKTISLTLSTSTSASPNTNKTPATKKNITNKKTVKKHKTYAQKRPQLVQAHHSQTVITKSNQTTKISRNVTLASHTVRVARYHRMAPRTYVTCCPNCDICYHVSPRHMSYLQHGGPCDYCGIPYFMAYPAPYHNHHHGYHDHSSSGSITLFFGN